MYWHDMEWWGWLLTLAGMVIFWASVTWLLFGSQRVLRPVARSPRRVVLIGPDTAMGTGTPVREAPAHLEVARVVAGSAVAPARSSLAGVRDALERSPR